MGVTVSVPLSGPLPPAAPLALLSAGGSAPSVGLERGAPPFCGVRVGSPSAMDPPGDHLGRGGAGGREGRVRGVVAGGAGGRRRRRSTFTLRRSGVCCCHLSRAGGAAGGEWRRRSWAAAVSRRGAGWRWGPAARRRLSAQLHRFPSAAGGDCVAGEAAGARASGPGGFCRPSSCAQCVGAGTEGPGACVGARRVATDGAVAVNGRSRGRLCGGRCFGARAAASLLSLVRGVKIGESGTFSL